MAHLIDKDALVAEIERKINSINLDTIEDWRYRLQWEHDIEVMKNIISLIDTLEVKDPYEQIVQYDSIKVGIQAYAVTYSFNIESELFNQLTKEQQALWRKEMEQACISGGGAGYSLAKDLRYKENVEVKDVDLEKFTEKINTFQARYKHPEIISIKGAMAFMARMFYQYPNVAREWYESLPKATMD